MKRSILMQLDRLEEPKRMALVPVDERDEELALIAYAKAMNGGDAINKLALLELLERYSKTDEQCSGSCVDCVYQQACEKLQVYLEVFG